MSSKVIRNVIAKMFLYHDEIFYSISHNSSNIVIPNPPSRGAKNNSFLSFSVIIIPHVIAGISSVRIIY